MSRLVHMCAITQMCGITHLSVCKVANLCDIICSHTATHCNILLHTATHCNTLRHTATRCDTLQHTATHCNTRQHTATHCNTLQHTATHHLHLHTRINMSKSCLCVTWLIHMPDSTHSHVWYDPCKCVTWLIHVRDIICTYTYTLSDSLSLSLSLSHTHSHDVKHTKHPYVWHDSLIGATWLIWICEVVDNNPSYSRLI